jgi:hypothetical protein
MPRYDSDELDGVTLINLFHPVALHARCGDAATGVSRVGMEGYVAVFRKLITRSVSRPVAAWSKSGKLLSAKRCWLPG